MKNPNKYYNLFLRLSNAGQNPGFGTFVEYILNLLNLI